MTPPLRLDLRPSRRLAACLGLLHAAAFGAAIASLPAWGILAAATGVMLSAVVSIRGVLLMRLDSVRSLELSGDSSALWREGDGEGHEAFLAHEGYVSAWLVVLALDPVHAGSPRRWVVLAPDSAEPESLRQLRVRLRSRQTLGIPPDNHAAG